MKSPTDPSLLLTSMDILSYPFPTPQPANETKDLQKNGVKAKGPKNPKNLGGFFCVEKKCLDLFRDFLSVKESEEKKNSNFWRGITLLQIFLFI